MPSPPTDGRSVASSEAERRGELQRSPTSLKLGRWPAAMDAPVSWSWLAGLAAVATIAAATRLSSLSIVEFKYDEARVAMLALRFVQTGRAPETSIVTSAGVQNSPLFIYLMAPAAAISWRPEFLTTWVAIANVIAVLLAAMLVARYWGRRAGFLCGLLYSLAPVAVQYSRKIWAPELMPLFSVLCLGCLLLLFVERRPWFLVAAAASWAVLIQLHQAAIWLVPGFFVVTVVGSRRLRPLPVLAAVLAALATAAPYLGYEHAHGWADLHALLSIAGRPATLSAQAWWDVWALSSGWGLPSFLGPADQILAPGATERNAFDLLWLLLFASGIATLIANLLCRSRSKVDSFLAGPPVTGGGSAVLSEEKRHAGLPGAESSAPGSPLASNVPLPSIPTQHVPVPDSAQARANRARQTCPRRLAGLIVLLWTLLPPLGLTRSSVPIFPHYLVYWYPAPFIVVALGIDLLGSLRLPRIPTWLPPTLAIGCAVLLLTNDALRIVRFRATVVARDGGGDYGAPLRDSEVLVSTTVGLAGSGRRYIMNRGDLPAVYRYLDRAGGAAYVAPDHALVLPPPGRAAVYVTTSASYRGIQQLEALAAPATQTLPGRYRLLFLEPDAVGSLSLSGNPVPANASYQTAAGVRLVGWTGAPVLTTGTQYHLTLWWLVTASGEAPRGELKLFSHLLDPARKTVAQDDALGYPPRYWVVGERFATYLTMNIPAALPREPYRLVVGLYAMPGFRGVAVTGPSGNALGSEIPLATLHLAAR